MQRILVTISDGSLGTAAGIHILWRSLLRHRPEFGREWDPVVLYPSWAWPPTQPCVDALRDHRILAIDQERHADPYAAKLVLGNFVSTLPDATEILYLDYDHVCLSPFAPVTPSAGTVQVGSRVVALRLVGGQDGLARGSDLNRLLNGRHFNSSLVHGRCVTLRVATSLWQTAYAELDGIVDPRVHEETAFSASAMTAGVDVRPVATSVQAEWADADPYAPLFHYGGDSVEAQALKRALPELEQTGGLPEDCVAVLSRNAAGRRILDELAAPKGRR